MHLAKCDQPGQALVAERYAEAEPLLPKRGAVPVLHWRLARKGEPMTRLSTRMMTVANLSKTGAGLLLLYVGGACGGSGSAGSTDAGNNGDHESTSGGSSSGAASSSSGVSSTDGGGAN